MEAVSTFKNGVSESDMPFEESRRLHEIKGLCRLIFTESWNTFRFGVHCTLRN